MKKIFSPFLDNKKHTFIFVLVLVSIEGIIILTTMLSVPSARENILVLGLSAPRVVLASFILTGSLTALGLALLTGLFPRYTRIWGQRLNLLLSNPEKLLIINFFLLMVSLVCFILIGLLLLLGASRILERIAPVSGWVGVIGIQVLIGLKLTYANVFQRPDFLEDAPRKIIRFVFQDLSIFWIGIGILGVSVVTVYWASSISNGGMVGHDSGIFLYFGQQILRGDLPFRDLWDHKPPLIFYLNSLGLWIGQGSLWGIWALELFSLTSGALLGFLALQRGYGRWAASISIMTVAAHSAFFLEGGNLTEEFSLPLQWAVLYLAFTLNKTTGLASRMLITGVLFATALSLKQTMVGVWAAFAILLVLRMIVFLEWYRLKMLAWAVGGAIFVLLGVVVFFAVQGALGQFWSVAYQFNLIYSDITVSRRLWAYGEMITYLCQSSPFFCFTLVLWLVGILSILRRANRSGIRSVFSYHPIYFPLVFSIINLPIEMLLINTSGKNYRHYFLSLLPVMSVLAAWGLSGCWLLSKKIFGTFAGQEERWKTVRTVSRVSAAVLLTGLFFWSPVRFWRVLSEAPYKDVVTAEVVKYIRVSTEPDDYVLMWGSQTTVNFLSGRLSPTRFVHQKPLFRDKYSQPELINEFLNDIQEKRPVLIINTHLPSTPFIRTSEDGTCQHPDHPFPNGMAKVFDYLCSHYQMEKVITKDRWEIYRLIE